MSAGSFVTPFPIYDATRSATDLAGTALSTNLEASGERVGRRSRLTQFRRAMERLLWERPHVTHEAQPRNAHPRREQIPSLADAFAGVPKGLGFAPAIHFRIVVYGRPQDLSAWLRDEIYHIGREAIVNAYRHSQANQVEVEIEYRHTQLRISVRDDGCGIDPQLLRWSEKHGLQGMRERAEGIGGRFRILSKVALGTEIELCVPGRIAFEQRGHPACHA